MRRTLISLIGEVYDKHLKDYHSSATSKHQALLGGPPFAYALQHPRFLLRTLKTGTDPANNIL